MVPINPLELREKANQISVQLDHLNFIVSRYFHFYFVFEELGMQTEDGLNVLVLRDFKDFFLQLVAVVNELSVFIRLAQ